MNRMLKRFLCVFLSVVMMLTMIPVGAYAKEEITKVSCSEEENIEIEYEIESKRTENSKTYITSDGGYYQVTALVPIHEKVNPGRCSGIYLKRGGCCFL